MTQPVPTESRQHEQDARQLARWARVFGQNRGGIAVAISLVIVALLCATGGTFSYLAGKAYRAGNTLLLTVCIAVLIPWFVALVYLSVPRWGGKLVERTVKWICRDEGSVTILAPQTRTRRWLGLALALGFFACIVGSVVLEFLLDIPIKYMQPISALYVVPFLVGLSVLMRPAGGLLALLWPVLYGLHAILIIAGVPILFTGEWHGLNLLLPIVGYGLLTGLVSYAYARYALRKLRRLARSELPGDAVNNGETD